MLPVLLSPKSQSHELGDPVEISVNVVGLPTQTVSYTKSATGMPVTVTVPVMVLSLLLR